MVLLLWSRSTENATGSGPASKWSCVILSVVYGSFAWWGETGDEDGRQAPCKLVWLLLIVYA